MAIVLLIIGLALLTVGAEVLVRGASGLARAAGLPSLVIGLTVVAFGTSAPELAVSVKASVSGQADIALGNVIGSNIFNVLFILGVSALMLMKSLLLNETTTANKPKPNTNPHVGKFDVVSSVYLSNASFTGASSKAWYLMADPNRVPAIEVAFLNGVDRPTVEKTDADFNTLGVMFRGYIDFGVREQDYRGALRMKGEA